MKRLLSGLLALVLVAGLFLSVPLGASAESMYIRKIVSVVYDDSGSMSGPKWGYANYAMQAFCGMLNSEDQLFITYMSHSQYISNYDPKQIDLSSGGIQNSVDQIRGHSDGGSTPYGSVQIAMDKLQSVPDTNPNTQYWLVVITDGVFDEHSYLSDKQRKKTLQSDFEHFTDTDMPNGTKPQVTFLAIGDTVVAPDEDTSKGIYTYKAADAAGITDAMAKMADRVSGRTRLSGSDITMVDSKTIEVSSAIPLLNIAVFAQETDAKITKAVYDNEKNIPISREANLAYKDSNVNMHGGAYLVGDSQSVIGSGTYRITFDKDVDLKDVVVLFEPALEMRMEVSVNGQPVTDLSSVELYGGDKITFTSKIYEMGTNNEIDPNLLPPGTKYSVSVKENGQVAHTEEGEDMTMVDYELNPGDTELEARVTISGFAPIVYTEKLSTVKDPSERHVYTLQADYGSGTKSVRYDDMAANKDLSLVFTLLDNGVPVTNPAEVTALNFRVEADIPGNGGTTELTDDGKIVFTPNTAAAPSGAKDSYDVKVTCSMDRDITAELSYTVLLADYQVVSVGTSNTITKTKFFGNTVDTTFYITKDGVQLPKSEVENSISVLFNESQSHLKSKVEVDPDGTIHVTPYVDEDHPLTFWNWWVNWAYYFGLEGDDVTVTLSHSYGSARSTIDVVGESLGYQILNVYIPLAIEIIVFLIFAIWVILVVTKPRYSDGAVLYVGEVKYDKLGGTHVMRNFAGVRLNKFNKIKRGNGRLKYKREADEVSANGVRIRADRGGRILCEMPFPWYRGYLEPSDSDLITTLKTPKDVADYFSKHRKLEIVEFATTETVEGEHNRGLVAAGAHRPKYFVVPDNGAVTVVEGRKVIRSGKIFVYVNG